MSILGMLSAALTPQKRIARTAVRGLIVSTVKTSDMGPETAIVDSEGAKPVERYETVKAAKAGHQRWTAQCRKGLKRVKQLGYGGLVESRSYALRPYDVKSQAWKQQLKLLQGGRE